MCPKARARCWQRSSFPRSLGASGPQKAPLATSKKDLERSNSPKLHQKWVSSAWPEIRTCRKWCVLKHSSPRAFDLNMNLSKKGLRFRRSSAQSSSTLQDCAEEPRNGHSCPTALGISAGTSTSNRCTRLLRAYEPGSSYPPPPAICAICTTTSGGSGRTCSSRLGDFKRVPDFSYMQVSESWSIMDLAGTNQEIAASL